jgi:hypothetical protein
VSVAATMSEDFEGTWPAAGWEVVDTSSSDGGEYLWGKRDCHPHTGTYGGWSVGGGAQGSALGCSDDYPNYARSWAVYGPFDLSAATGASLTFHLWGRAEAEPECAYDYLYVGSSTDGESFSNGVRHCGNWTNGDAGNGYYQRILDLSSRLGESQVWIGFVFISDSSVADNGFTIDDVTLSVDDTSTPTATPTHTATPTSTPTPINTLQPEPTLDEYVYLPLVAKGYPSSEQTPTPTLPTSTPTPTATPTATPPGITPKDGDWTGTNDQGRPLSFAVASNGTQIPQFKLQVGFGGACGVAYMESYFYDITITNNAFSATSSQNEITGTFTGDTAASGTYKVVLEIHYPSYCKATRTGTWTASTP